MLFRRAFQNYLKPMPPKIYPRLDAYLRFLNREILSTIERYQNAPPMQNPGMMTLEYILNQLPIEEMRKEKDQTKRYRKFIEPTLDTLGRSFDCVQTHKAKAVSFLESGYSAKEYMVSVRCENPFTQMPIGKGWQEWKEMKPFRLVFCNSRELTFQTYQDKIKFGKDQPSLMVYTLNAPMLAMMYTEYLNTLSAIPTGTLLSFLHHYIIFPSLLRDNVTLWLRDRYLFCIEGTIPNNNKGFEDAIWKTAYDGRVGAQYPQFIEDIYALIKLGMQGNVYPNVLLSSFLLLENISVLDYFDHFRKSTQLPSLRQYSWIEYLIFSRWMALIAMTVHICPNAPDVSTFRNDFLRELSSYVDAHPWTDCTDQMTRHYIEKSLKELTFMVSPLSRISNSRF